MRKIMPYSSVIFDLDGTLSDPREGFVASMRHALERFEHPVPSESCLLRFIGPPLEQSFREMVSTADDASLNALVAAYREHYAAQGVRQNRLYAGIASALERLHARGMSLGVCTSKRADFAETILQSFGLRHYFGFVSGGEVGVSKTEQLRSLLSAGLLGDGAVMIGDRSFDLVAAADNDLYAIGVLWGYGSRQELEMYPSLALVESPLQMTQFLLGEATA